MRRVLPVLVAVVGAVLAGVGLWFSIDHHPASFGWTAYAPLSSGDTVPYVPYLGPPAWALASIVVGCVALGASLTLLVARVRSR